MITLDENHPRYEEILDIYTAIKKTMNNLKFTPELVNDLKSVCGMDVEQELKNVIGEEIIATIVKDVKRFQ